MSKIQFEQIGENEVEVFLPAETPLEMVEALTKSFISKGLVEDLKKSTVSTRYFFRPQDKANQMADELIKSLSTLAKDDEPYWSRKSKQTMRIKNDVKDALAARKPAPPMNEKPAPTGTKMYDHDAKNAWTAEGTGKRYAYIKDPVSKMETITQHPDDCNCGQCEEVEKSGYGPKGASQYNLVDNIRRKATNVGQLDIGPNANVKRYTSDKFSGMTPQTDPKIKRRQPVKQWSPEQIAAENAKRGLKKAWGQHLPFPSAEEEIMNLASETAQSGEDALSNQLANMMQSKNMLSNHQQPSKEEFEAAGERMGLGVTEEMAKSAEKQWNGAINNWLAEATKPISSRFASEEEELAYWNSIKVADRDDGKSGY